MFEELRDLISSSSLNVDKNVYDFLNTNQSSLELLKTQRVENRSILSYVAQYGRIDLFKHLLEDGFDKSTISGDYNLLFWALLNKNKNIIDHLFQSKSLLESIDPAITQLHIDAYLGKYDSLEKKLANDSQKLIARNSTGHSPITYVVLKHCTESILAPQNSMQYGQNILSQLSKLYSDTPIINQIQDTIHQAFAIHLWQCAEQAREDHQYSLAINYYFQVKNNLQDIHELQPTDKWILLKTQQQLIEIAFHHNLYLDIRQAISDYESNEEMASFLGPECKKIYHSIQNIGAKLPICSHDSEDKIAHIDDDIFNTHLANFYDCEIVNVDKDGNCLFHAILWFLKKYLPDTYKNFDAGKLRSDSTKYIQKNPAVYLPSFEDEEFDQYLNFVEESAFLPDEHQIAALSNLYEINIFIIFKDDSLRPLIYKANIAKYNAFILFDSSHQHFLVLNPKQAKLSQPLQDLLNELDLKTNCYRALTPQKSPIRTSSLNSLNFFPIPLHVRSESSDTQQPSLESKEWIAP